MRNASVSWSHQCRLSSTSSVRRPTPISARASPSKKRWRCQASTIAREPGTGSCRGPSPDGTSRSTSSAPDRLEPRRRRLGSRGAQPVRDRRQRQPPGGTEAPGARATTRPRARAASASSATRRVLPTPASPSTSTKPRAPPAAARHTAPAASSSCGPRRRAARRRARRGSAAGVDDRRGVLASSRLQRPVASPGPARRRARAPGPRRSGGRCSLRPPGHRVRPAAPSACGSRPPPAAAAGPAVGRPRPPRPGRRCVPGSKTASRTAPRTGARARSRASSIQSSCRPGQELAPIPVECARRVSTTTSRRHLQPQRRRAVARANSRTSTRQCRGVTPAQIPRRHHQRPLVPEDAAQLVQLAPQVGQRLRAGGVRPEQRRRCAAGSAAPPRARRGRRPARPSATNQTGRRRWPHRR